MSITEKEIEAIAIELCDDIYPSYIFGWKEVLITVTKVVEAYEQNHIRDVPKMVEGVDYTKSCGDVFEDLGLPSQKAQHINEYVIPETLKWISEKPTINADKIAGTMAIYSEWEKNAPDAFDMASAIVFQNNRFAYLEEALMNVMALAYTATYNFNGEKFDRSELEAKFTSNVNIREFVDNVLNEVKR